MEWKNTTDAAKAWAGGIAPRFLWAAVKRGELQCARFGAGRNLLFCEQFITDWLMTSTQRGRMARTATGEVIEMRPQPKSTSGHG